MASDLLATFPARSPDGQTMVYTDASEAIQVNLLILHHVLQCSGRKEVNGLGLSLIAFTDKIKKCITSRSYTHPKVTRTQAELSTKEFEVKQCAIQGLC